MSIAIRQKDPADVETFTLSWASLLTGIGPGVTITGSTWAVPAGLTETDADFTTSSTSITVSGGTDGQDYELVNHIILSDLQERERSFTLQIRQEEGGSSQDATDRSKAVALLLRWVQKDVAPPLTQTNIEAILDSHKVAATWKVSTSYAVGQRILPPTRNGWWYEVIQPGTSQSSPRTFSEWPTIYGLRFGDGSSDPQLILEVAGEDSIFRAEHADPLSINCYDVRGAARECVQTRLQLASHFVDDGDVSFDQITKHLEGLLTRFYPIRFPMKVMRA